MDYLASYTEAELLAHGRMRVLRIERNKHARLFRESVEALHSELLRAVRGLDTESVHKPLDAARIRRLYRMARRAEGHMLAIDELRGVYGATEQAF